MNIMDKQTMTYLGFFAVIILFLAVQYIISRRKQYQRMCRKVKEQWGRPPVREYSLEEFEKISHYFEKRKDGRFFIDDITWNDMGMDDIFLLLNTAGSAIGEEYLYWALRTPEFDENVLKERSELADFFRSHEKEREAYAICFARMGRKKRVALSDYIEKLEEMPRFPLLPHVISLALLLGALASFAVRPSVGVGILVAAVIINLVTYYKYKGDAGIYFQCMSQAADLVEYGIELNKISSEEMILISYKQTLKECSSILKPVRNQAWILVDKSSMGGSLIKAVLDYFCMITHLDLILFRRITKIVKDKGEILERLMETMGKLELSLCIGSYRDFLGIYCEPVLHKEVSKRFSCEGIVHPLIEDAVSNSIQTDRPVLITGSNASGKSTFLKMIGINAILAQTIYTVSAARFEMDFCRVYSSMALTDSLETKESYYMVEIRSLKRILDALGEGFPVLCFIDEVLRGTNTVERISASTKILESMTEKNILCFAATHDIELTRLLDRRFSNYHFEEQVQEDDVSFSYKLEPGRAETRNAIRLLGIMGYEKEIIESAEDMAERFVKTGEWKL